MIRDILKWVVPGLATVLAGSTLSLAMTSGQIASDVATQSAALTQRAGFDWAELSFSMRDVTVSGTTTDQRYVDAAETRLGLVPGVRSVTSAVTLAPLASPYRLQASLADGKIALAGGVPDETTRQLLLARANLQGADLALRSGMPERRLWVAGAQFAIDQLRFFDQGEATISDLSVELSGRAKSERDFRDLLIVLRAGAPAGVTLGNVEITPALVSPYQWNANSDGKRIDVSGYVPDAALVERYRAAATGGLPVATGLALGSGEPAGFADISQTLLEQLSSLEYGSASISDGQITLTGAPPTREIAQAVTQALEASGATVDLEPPRVDDYWVSATLQDGGALVFDGFVPDAATRDAMGQIAGADTSWLQLGRGAPERYQSAMDFGLAALARMSAGRFSLRQTVLSLSGVALSGEDYLALLATISEDAPQGFVLARAEIAAPVAMDYQWSALKAPSGAIALTGMVPSPDVKASLLSAAGPSSSETLGFASGEPRNFAASAQTGLALLNWLSEGQIVFDGTGWTITGSAKSAIDRAAIEADFVSRKLAGAGWSMTIAAVEPAIAAAKPYTWSAQRTPEGVTLSGHVPTEDLKHSLAVHAGDDAADTSELASGEPADFAAVATAALDAVMALDTAAVQFDGAAWSLRGEAASIAARDATLAALAQATDTSKWTLDIAAPDPVPAAPYVWTATKMPSGALELTGRVPTDTLKRAIADQAGNQLTDGSAIDPTAPDGFGEDALAAISALSNISDGLASFDGTQWRIDGNLIAADSAAAVDAALANATTPLEAWSLTLLDPPPAPQPVVPEAAIVEPTAADPAPVEAVAPPVDPAYAFSASRSEDGTVILSGQVPSDPALRDLSSLSGGDTAAVSVADGAPTSFLPNAEIGLGALLRLNSGQLDFADRAWRLAGIAPDDAERDAVLAAIAADTGADWTVSVDAPAPVIESPVIAEQPADPTKPKVDISACAGPIDDFSGRNAILFQSGAALIATESEAALDELIIVLAECPDALIHVEGHTDADGDARLNLGLSVARAEAVVKALIDRGINPARLYAVGYGETKPVADNATSAGKRQNRRIVVTVSDEHF